MILFIDTTQGQEVLIAIKTGGKVVSEKKFSAPYSQAEKLLPEIDRLLAKTKLKLKDLSSIEVNNQGGGFTALRIGVITANALGFALGIPVRAAGEMKPAKTSRKFSVIAPEYEKEPNITLKKKNNY